MEEKTCLKCGRACSEKDSFCEECLADMKKYPVKPGVVVLLPQQTRQAKPVSRRRHTAPSPEEQLPKLKKQLIALWMSLILTLGAAAGLGWLLVEDYLEEEATKLLPGQNYSAEETKAAEDTH